MTHDLSNGGAGIPPAPPTTDPEAGPPARDDLDSLLRQWHDEHGAQARAGRDRLIAALARVDAEPAPSPVLFSFRRVLMSRYSPAAAAALVLGALLTIFLLPQTTTRSQAQPAVVMAPDGGRLDAVDPEGNVLGPCELKHTDVSAEISGFFSRVTLRQKYHNPHADKIEAVYTFPMSHRAAVDRMTMTVGDRVIIGEVKERQQARQIYEAARAEGRVASLLEQERPNIFTQSVANIEPGADIDIEISYVEVLEQRDGSYAFEFPTVVGPRYIPGTPTQSIAPRPGVEGAPAFTPRRGVILLAPATIRISATGDVSARGTLTAAQISDAVSRATPIAPASRAQGAAPAVWYEFRADYPDGSAEIGRLFTDGSGNIGGRWLYCPQIVEGPGAAHSGPVAPAGANFAPNTTQVPDASKITPMPVKPPTRAGHDVSITVTIDTGGPGITSLSSALHEIVRRDGPGEKASRTVVTLKNAGEIPNRDFMLSWKTQADTIQESTLTHTGKNGNFLSLILQPPARIEPDEIVPRELVFVLDTSGSMDGYPIEKSKQLVAKAIESMRPADTFNIITFAGDTHILWNQPRPNTPENRAEAQRFVASRSGAGGTEMMTAINAALLQQRLRAPGAGPAGLDAINIDQLRGLPADGRQVTVLAEQSEPSPLARFPGEPVKTIGQWVYGQTLDKSPANIRRGLIGRWSTENGERVLVVDRVVSLRNPPTQPLRIVFFLTDAYVGNDFAIIDAIRKNRDTTRVFSFGIGNSVNRFLIDGMARAGGGEPEYVSLESDADAAVDRLLRRISAPVLANIKVEFVPAEGGGFKVVDLIPAPSNIPDLFDQKPLVLQTRYTQAGKGTLILTGTTGAGPYRREIALDLPAAEPQHDTIATLWARAKVDSLMNEDLKAVQSQTFPDELRQEVIRLGETFGIMTQYTSFVAVDRLRVTVGGKPRLVHIPIELPKGVSWEGNFGGLRPQVSEGPYLALKYEAGLSSFAGQTGIRNINAASADELRALPTTLGDGAPQFYDAPQVDLFSVLVFNGSVSAELAVNPGQPSTGDGVAYRATGGRAALLPWSRGDTEDFDAGDRTRSNRSAGGRAATPSEPADPGLAVSGTSLISSPTRVYATPSPATPGNPMPALATKPQSTPPPQAAPAAPAPGRMSRFGNVEAQPTPARGEPADKQIHRALGGSSVDDKEKERLGAVVQLLKDRVDPTGATSVDTSVAAVRERGVGLDHRSYGESQEAAAGDLGFTVRMKSEAEDWPARSFYRYEWRDLEESWRSTDPRQPVQQIVPADLLTFGISELVAKGRVEVASALAAKLAAAAPAYPPGVELNTLLAKPPAPPADVDAASARAPESPPATPADTSARDQRIAELGAQAKARLDELARRATLARRLDPRLLVVADSADLPQELDPTYKGRLPDGVELVDGGILVSILLADTQPATLTLLKAAGLRIDHVSAPTKVVVGIVPLGRLAEVGLAEKVRRVEPTN